MLRVKRGTLIDVVEAYQPCLRLRMDYIRKTKSFARRDSK